MLQMFPAHSEAYLPKVQASHLHELQAMIGLCRGLAYQAHLDTGNLHLWKYTQYSPTFAIAGRNRSRSSLATPISHRYYQLLDACPLRMRPEPRLRGLPIHSWLAEINAGDMKP